MVPVTPESNNRFGVTSMVGRYPEQLGRSSAPVDLTGIEPALAACKAAVLPLNDRPIGAVTGTQLRTASPYGSCALRTLTTWSG